MITIGLIEENFYLLKSYKEFLEGCKDIRMGFSFQNFEELLENHRKQLCRDVHVLLTDIFSNGKPCFEILDFFRKNQPNCRVIVFSSSDSHPVVVESIRRGAMGYFLKSPMLMEIYHAILQVHQEGAYLAPRAAYHLINHMNGNLDQRLAGLLTRREKELVLLLKDGLSYKELADKMFVSVHTINYHLKKIYQKMKVDSRSQLISKLMNSDF